MALSGLNGLSGLSGVVPPSFTWVLEEQLTLIGWPFIPISTDPNIILGDNWYGTEASGTADNIEVWNPATQLLYTKSYFSSATNTWLEDGDGASSLVLSQDIGFWIRNRSGSLKTFTAYGVPTSIYSSYSLVTGINYLGFSFLTKAISIDDVEFEPVGGSSPLDSDQIKYYDADTQTFRSAFYCTQPWGEPYENHWLKADYNPTDIELVPGYGIQYHSLSDRAWTFLTR